jgi:2-haloacid dehalogenase
MTRRQLVKSAAGVAVALRGINDADRWLAGYAPSMEKVRRGEMPWTNLDHLHRALLEDLLTEFHIEGLSEEEKDHWNRVWDRLKLWPDSVAGLTRLKKKYTIAPLSNGNRSAVGFDSVG